MRLLNANDGAVQVVTQGLIWPGKPTSWMKAEQRNACPLLEGLNRSDFDRRDVSAQLLTQATNGWSFEHGTHRQLGIQGVVYRGDHSHCGKRIPAEVEE